MLNIQIKKPLVSIQDAVQRVPEVRAAFEPEKFGLSKSKLEDLYSKNLVVLAAVEDVRTWFMANFDSGDNL
jgi:hypothetical protein